MVAFGLPPITTDHIKMRTVTCKRPTIVKGPEDPDSLLAQIGEKEPQMAVVAVKVVHMHHRRPNALQITNQTLSRYSGVKAIQSKYAREESLHFYVKSPCINDSIGMVAVLLHVQYVVLYPLFIQQLADSTADVAGTPSGTRLIDLNDNHQTLLSFPRRIAKEWFMESYKPGSVGVNIQRTAHR